jgi:hypothetical protein
MLQNISENSKCFKMLQNDSEYFKILQKTSEEVSVNRRRYS